MYVYAGGDPVGYLDPFGLASVDAGCVAAATSLLISSVGDLFLGYKMLKGLGAAGGLLMRTLNGPFSGGLIPQGFGRLGMMGGQSAALRTAREQTAGASSEILQDIRTYSAIDVLGEVSGGVGSALEGQRGIWPYVKDAALGLVPFYGSYWLPRTSSPLATFVPHRDQDGSIVADAQ